MKTNEKIYSIIIVSILLIMLAYWFWKKSEIDKNPIYVIGKVNKIYDTENGFLYKFTYVFDGKKYNSGIKGLFQLQDSLLILKISKTNPKLWRLANVKIPDCILNDSSLSKNWEKLPACNSYP